MSNADADIALAHRIAAGDDRDAEAALYRNLAPRVRAYGVRHLGDDDAADDLVQQVLLVVIERLRDGRLREPDKVHSFTLSTCRLTVTNLRRGEHRRRNLLDQAAPWLADAAAAAARGSHAAPGDLARLAACFEHLDARARAVVFATFFADEPATSIASSLSTSVGNVRVLRHRALRSLHDCVTEAA